MSGRSTPARWLSWLAAAALLIATADNTRAAAPGEISPPFGLRWGETDIHVQELLAGAKAKIVDRRDVSGRQAWTVEGLLQTGLKRALFYFQENALVEVELQYQNDAWDVAKYDSFMGQVRRKVEQKYGAGTLLARTKGPEEDVTQTVVGYKWEQNNTAIELFYYSAEKGAQVYRAVSVHYRLQ
jgi:hypothetical protein